MLSLNPSLDCNNGSATLWPRARSLIEFMDTHELTDVWRVAHPDSKRYTSFQSGTLTRIDLMLASPSFLTHVVNSAIGVSYATDHAPVYMIFSLSQDIRGRGLWRCPAYLLKDPVYVKRIENIVDHALTNSKQLDPNKLWDFIKLQIRSETIQYLGECNKAKKAWTVKVETDIQTLALARDRVVQQPEVVKSYSAKIKLLQIERDELIQSKNRQEYLFNVARKHYESNRSTKYYYRLPGCRYDSIKRLKVDDNTEDTSSKGILQECHKFYSELYNKVPHPNSKNEDSQWHFLKNISANAMGDPILMMDAPITQTEMLAALNKMKVEASPGMDGLTVAFYQKFWHKLATPLLRSFQYSADNKRLSPSQCRGIIRLIPKKDKDLFWVRNWRPITLLNVDYKILSKSLASRLASILPELIHKDQRGFVQGRYIGDNIMEVYALVMQAESEQEQGILMQLDIEKAFDSVSWDFLYEVLNNFNFPDSFIEWVKILYCNKEVRIINNGHLSPPLYPTNGLAQGDGLSPLLFILVIETLALSIRANDKIEGYKIDSIHKKLSLLADDLILSLKAKQSTFHEVLSTLTLFAQVSNLAVNAEKSAVFPLGSLSSTTPPAALDIAPFKWSSEEHMLYLGIPTPISSHSRIHYYPAQVSNIIQSADSLLSPRNSFDDVIPGRVLNVKTFVASKLQYYFALAPTPNKSFLDKVQSKLNNYVWSYGKHHVEACLLYRPYDRGGVNMYCIRNHNSSMKIKAVNKLCTVTNEYWQKVLKQNFTISMPSLAKINLHFQHIHRIIKHKLPLFWHQAITEWCLFNYKPPTECSRDALLLCNSALKSKMVFDIPRMLKLQEAGIFTIQDLLNNHTAHTPLSRRIKKLWPTGPPTVPHLVVDLCKDLTVRNIRALLLEKNTTQPTRIWNMWTSDTNCNIVAQSWTPICKIRKIFTSVKLQNFYWKFINRALPTNYFLHKYGVASTPSCTFCKTGKETFFHLYWQCPAVATLWSKIILWCKLFITENVNYNCQNCLILGFPINSLNYICLLTKYYIHIQRLFYGTLDFKQLLCRIRSCRYKDYTAYSILPYLSTYKYTQTWGKIPQEAFPKVVPKAT